MRRVFFVLGVVFACAVPAAAAFVYPVPPTANVVDDYFGTKVADPYRPLEEIDAPATRAWAAAEGALTRRYLDAIPQRAAIRAAYARLLNHPRESAPFREGRRWFFFANTGLQNQNVLFVRDGLAAPARVFLDPNRLSKDGTVALADESFTRDGRLMAYATQANGSDWETWHVRDVATGRDLPDVLRWSKYSPATWLGDRAFSYTAYDRPHGENATLATLGVEKLYLHRLGTPQRDDRLIFAETAHPDRFLGTEETQDGRYLFFEESKGNGNSLAWRRPGEAAFHPLLPLDPNVSYVVLGDDGDRLYLRTNAGAPRSRIVWVDLREPAPILHTLVPQRGDTLQDASLIGRRFYLSYLHQAHALTEIADLRGRILGAIALPGIGSGGLPHAKRTDRIAFYTFTSYALPTTIYRYDTRTGRSTVYHRPRIPFDPAKYVTEEWYATSRDGTRVPVFFTHRKGLRYDGRTPVLQYGYGGFDIDETPYFATGAALWLQMGGAYADVVLRGGGEFGEAWHDAGRLGNKQHVFDDFVAASRLLIARHVTTPARLAIEGGSNGGLLVGATLTQHPELYGAAIPEVGVLDMLRYPLFTVGKAWIPEYGDARASAAAFRWLHAYSPLQNVRPGTRYPATLVMTSDHDDRVYPAHSFKFAAALQHAQAGPAPILLRVETKAGHGAGRPLGKILDETADEYGFLVKNLRFSPALPAR